MVSTAPSSTMDSTRMGVWSGMVASDEFFFYLHGVRYENECKKKELDYTFHTSVRAKYCMESYFLSFSPNWFRLTLFIALVYPTTLYGIPHQRRSKKNTSVSTPLLNLDVRCHFTQWIYFFPLLTKKQPISIDSKNHL